MKGSEPETNAPKATPAATFSTATAEPEEKSPAKPTDEQAAADDVIDAILADMKKAQE
jgi:hypothetical protein